MRLMPTLALLLISAPALGEPQAIWGDWLTDDRSAIVRVAPCGPDLCGTILRVLDPAAPKNDINNPDPARRTHPLVGTMVLTHFKPATRGWADGSAYDPKAGRSYRSRVALDGAGTLKVTGCISFLCRTRAWSRAAQGH